MLVLSARSSNATCNLNGNWTSSRQGTPPEQVVHIEFFQEPGSTNFTLRATPWGSTLSYGSLNTTTNTTGQLLMVGGSMTEFTISPSSQGHQPGPAPECTFLSFGWCKFPYCDVTEPDWPPWTPPMPVWSPSAPTWQPNWNLTESTVIQPSSNDYFDPVHPWGLISLDWSVARSIWSAPGRANSTCEAVSREGCRRLKASGKATRCFIYHNMELALEWEESQRAVMYNASTADYFLQYVLCFVSFFLDNKHKLWMLPRCSVAAALYVRCLVNIGTPTDSATRTALSTTNRTLGETSFSGTSPIQPQQTTLLRVWWHR